MIPALQSLTPTEETLIEIATLAARSGVVLVERAGSMALCSAANIPTGWHRVGIAAKGEAHATAV